jgi:hypothetical protein
MSSPYAIMRLPISRVALMLLAAGCIGSDATLPAIAQGVATYLVAATPHRPDSEQWYSASIYRIGADQHLVQVNHLFSPAEHLTDVVDDLHGHLFLAGDHGIYVVHEDDPRRLDFVALETFDTFPCFGAFAEPSGKTGIDYCVGGNIYRVMARSNANLPRVGTGSWLDFASIQYGGQIGGPFQNLTPLRRSTAKNW